MGAVLYPNGGEEEFKIKRSKIRGVESLGMLCAEDELGIGASHEGIMELPADAKVGQPAWEYLKLEDDYVIGIGLTPNRIDAASHIGVARDLAAYLKSQGKPVELQWPDVSAFAVDNHDLKIDVQVENSEAAPRYAGVTVKNCKDRPFARMDAELPADSGHYPPKQPGGHHQFRAFRAGTAPARFRCSEDRRRPDRGQNLRGRYSRS